MEYLAKTEEELPEIARDIISRLQHKIVLFDGEMGSGKTTLIKRLVSEMGSEDEVSSPTFSLVNEYSIIPNGRVFHFDLYRIKSEEEAMDFGVEEYLDSGDYCFIEWPDKIMDLISDEHHLIKINMENRQRRIIFV